MASKPRLDVMEDQTDEDFFDKLVDDGLEPSDNSDSAGRKLREGSDSDEVKAFGNLSIEDTSGDGGLDGKVEKDLVHDGAGLVGAQPDLVVGSTKSGVKEVGWSSFYADSMPNGDHGFGSYSDFFNDLGDGSVAWTGNVGDSANVEDRVAGGLDNLGSYEQRQDSTQVYGAPTEVTANGQDVHNSQYWEDMYPGWKYDANTGQWYPVDGNDVTASMEGSFDANLGGEWAAVSDGKTEVSYLQQSSQSVAGTMAQSSTTESVSSWNQVSDGANSCYPAHMVFDPQYPGWYYDMIVQEWCLLESYTSSMESSTVQHHDQQSQKGFAFGSHSENGNSMYNAYNQADHFGSEGNNIKGQHGNWSQSYGSYNQQGSNMQPPEMIANATISDFYGSQRSLNSHGSDVSLNSHVDQHKSFNSLQTVSSYENMSQGHLGSNGLVSQSFVPSGNFNQVNLEQNEHMNLSSNYYSSQNSVGVAQQSFQSNQPFSYSPAMGRSSAGRPPHALVTFGFGGKLIVMKDSNPLGNSSFGSQEPVGGSICVLNLMEIVLGNTENGSIIAGGACNYFHALGHQSFPGPLVGGNVGSKELNKWIDERITNCEAPDMDHKKGEALRLLLSLLKIACQHYGKLRSPFGTDASLRESDAPESAVAKLFASAKRNGTQFSEYGVLHQCLQSLPSEGQVRETASEVQNLLVSGRKKEALQCAQEGQLWGPALVLASQLGDQFYVDTVKKMAIRQLIAGSPLRTLCLLIAGQPADVFAAATTAVSGFPSAVKVSPQPFQLGTNGMLDDWEENLAVITANRTKDDELVIIHLGDCLWKDRSEITAAHICYLVAEANFESYSDSARLCLIGADHLKHPRTFTSPEAIQRTELYEYSKVLGNSQFILFPFQPYKFIYACMLAEVGKVSDSLKYCQALLKSLKSGRAPEVETWKQLVVSLEERMRGHQQGGYAANLAPAKLVGKLLTFFDSTAHRVVGGLPPPGPSASHGSMQGNEHYKQSIAPRVSASQSIMAVSSLTSASMEPINEWAADGNRMTMQNRSVSEPDFGRSPSQVDSSKDGTSPSAQGKTQGSVRGSRFGRLSFGSQLLQKTVGLVLRPRSDQQAKLGETNKFYYDEKLKRWVEEGAEPPAEEAALPPPPITSAFQNGMPGYNLKSALKNNSSPTNGSPTPLEQSSGTPPIPASSNQFSTRGRMGVRARYVDPFNKGQGSSANLFLSSTVPSAKPPVAANQKFFVPTPAPSGENLMETLSENVREPGTAESLSTSASNESLHASIPSSSTPMQRFPSMDNITRKGKMPNGNPPISSHSRRTASWSGSFSDSFSPPRMAETKTLGEALAMPPSSFMANELSLAYTAANGGNFGDDLHEVQL
uniref:Protein transport protein sec16 n=2 Tax=Rhizophora mucronata TaxID=61149 RepID=A0A2P2MGH5_RHIMU